MGWGLWVIELNSRSGERGFLWNGSGWCIWSLGDTGLLRSFTQGVKVKEGGRVLTPSPIATISWGCEGKSRCSFIQSIYGYERRTEQRVRIFVLFA